MTDEISIGEIRNSIIHIIRRNDITELENYIQERNINFNELNNENFDILIYIIEKNVSLNIIKYIMNQCKYETFNYYIIVDNIVKTPLFLTLGKNNFELANLLIENKANINYFYNDIVNNLYHQNLLNNKNLKYILYHGLNKKAITSSLINNFIENSQNKLLEIILKYYVYDSHFILNLIKISSYNQSLSNEQLNNMLMKEQNKLIINDDMYEKAENCSNNEAIKLLFEHDKNVDKYSILTRIIKYDILKIAVDLKDIKFLKKILKYKSLNYKDYDFEEMLINVNNDNDFELLKLLISSSLKPLSKIKDKIPYAVYFNSILNRIICMNNLSLIKYLLENPEYKSKLNLNIPDNHCEFPIFTALYNNKMEIFEYLLKFDVNCTVTNNSNHVSLLSLAISTNNYRAVKSLLHKNNNLISLDKNKTNLITQAIYQNSLDILILLMQDDYCIHNIDNFNCNGFTPLILAYRLNYKKIFKFLLSFSSINTEDSNGKSILYYAIENEDIETIKKLMLKRANIHSNNLNKSKSSIIDLAISKGSEILKLFLIKGSNCNFIDKRKNTPLIYAIEQNSLSMIKLLVAYGANVNYFNPETNKTILKYAIDSGDIEIVKFLICSNANMIFENPQAIPIFGKTFKEIDNIEFEIFKYLLLKFEIKYITGNMVYKIIRLGKLDILKTLIDKNLNINIRDNDNDTPLANAIFYRNEKIANYLITLDGIDFNCKDNKGKNISDLNDEYFGKDEKYQDIYNRIRELI
ncbi:hypothetical protein BCR32DRAFT_268568 [Anaeromyces robustus]|uniref:Uncharacterized protein n=1 Tax=Anaeromyces robustus TaxID=1754192 RepID=A0A1Y1X6I5_9FUNG|nr:hypothetical protein BCR32DRAFT_268568 [Anaeromyces robustus]|eukprot:ORX80976.1 hypothetical protein BCR32DRAFT_268568 [Anaeromyces robustus]